MTNQLLHEERISLPKLADQLGVTRNTLAIWMDSGFRGQRLENFRIGRKRYSTTQAAERFVAAVSHQAEMLEAAV
jgi:hypothetical protein